VEQGRFHVYPVATVDEGIEVLTGLPAGARDAGGQFPGNTAHARALARLDKLHKGSPRDGEGKKKRKERAVAR
jgi:hypothetical protein